MSIEAAIYDILKSAAAVTALTGGTASPRIYPVGIPQGKSGVAVVVQQVSSTDDFSCEGQAQLHTDRIQLTCWSAQGGTPDDARSLADAVRTAMTAAAARGSHGGVTVQYIGFEDEGDTYDQNAESESLWRYGKRQDYEACYT